MDNQRSVISIEKVCRLAHQPNKFNKTSAIRRQMEFHLALGKALGKALGMAGLCLVIPFANAAEQSADPQAVASKPLSLPPSETALAGPESGLERLGGLSDTQLTNLAADWDQLDARARADLIAETRERMLPSQKAVSENAVSANKVALQSGSARLAPQGQAQSQTRVRAQRRRYGRVVRQADGSLVRIETQVITVRRRDPQRAFGVGFERRHRAAPSSDAIQQSVTTTVSTRVKEKQPATVTSAEPNPIANPRPVPERARQPIGQSQALAPGVIAVSKSLD